MAVLPVLGLAGVMSVVVECAVTESIQDSVADEHRAGVLGLGDAVMVSCAMVGTLVAPLLAAALGPRLGLVVLGGACVVVGAGRGRAVATFACGPCAAVAAPEPAVIIRRVA